MKTVYYVIWASGEEEVAGIRHTSEPYDSLEDAKFEAKLKLEKNEYVWVEKHVG